MGTKVLSSYTCFNRCRLTLRSKVSGNSQGESALMGDSEPCSLPRGLGNGMLLLWQCGTTPPCGNTRKWKFAAYNHLKINMEHVLMDVWKIIFLPKWVICRFHVNLPGCNHLKIPPTPWCDRTYHHNHLKTKHVKLHISVKLDFTSSFTCPAFSKLLTIKTST